MLKDNKLINLIKFWPQGAVFTSEWLIHEKGYSKGLLQQYRKSGWIELIGKGAYRRSSLDEKGLPLQTAKPLEWPGGVYALQALKPWEHEMPPLLVAARTALELAGYAHFLSLSGRQTVWLFVEPGYRIPTWFKNYKWGPQIKLYTPKLFSKPLPESMSNKEWGAFTTKISGPERAMLELLELCPKEESLEHAKLVMEGLATLRPQMVTDLLRSCTSIKVKRLFLALADICNHDWMKEVDTKKIDLGSGKRILESGQGFHSKFQISIPKGDERQNEK